jgi:hypothetical protein
VNLFALTHSRACALVGNVRTSGNVSASSVSADTLIVRNVELQRTLTDLSRRCNASIAAVQAQLDATKAKLSAALGESRDFFEPAYTDPDDAIEPSRLTVSKWINNANWRSTVVSGAYSSGVLCRSGGFQWIRFHIKTCLLNVGVHMVYFRILQRGSPDMLVPKLAFFLFFVSVTYRAFSSLLATDRRV